MVFALLLFATAAADLVPMRWSSPDPKTLELLEGTPVNCLVLDPAATRPDVVAAARSRNLTLLASVTPGGRAAVQARLAVELKLDGALLEGDVQPAAAEPLKQAKLTVVALPSRARLQFDARPIIGTPQAVWPGIQAEEDGKARAAPSGAPWIHTNGGFLRFLRAAAPSSTIWLGNTPPEKTVITPERYIQAIADAAIIGARWIFALDEEFRKRLEAREVTALRDWKRVMSVLAWYEAHPEWRNMQPLSRLGIVQDVASGALYSGGVLDMIAVKHTPVRPVPAGKLNRESLQGLTMAVNVDPSSLNDEQKAALTAMRRGGGSTLSGPDTWKFPPVTADRITLSESEVKMLDDIWKEMNQMTGRRNLGARLFNVSSMLSNLIESPDGKRAVLHLVNYSGFPVENVTVHLLGKYKTATLLAPGEPDRALTPYENDEGVGVDVDNVKTVAALVLE